MTRIGFVGAAIAILGTSSIAYAHHGKDYVLVESYDIPHPGAAFGLSTYSYSRDGGIDSSEIEPGLLFGVLPRVAVEVHAHAAKAEGESFHYEATAPAVHFQITDHHSQTPIQIGGSAEYEVAAHDGPNRFESRLIFEVPLSSSKITANVIGDRVEGDKWKSGYAAGYRADVSAIAALGVEAQGLFDSNSAQELLLGLYLEPTETITLKLSVGTGLRRTGPDFSARVGLVYQF